MKTTKRIISVALIITVLFSTFSLFAVSSAAAGKNGWVKSGSATYYYKNGVRLKGWQTINNRYGVPYKYYFNSSGVMYTGWKTINNRYGDPYRYYFGDNGYMRTGWQSIKNSKGVAFKYYFGDNGYMRTGWQTIKNSKGVKNKYYFGDNGYMRTGWQNITNAKGNTYRFYFGSDGVMRTGWQKIKASNGKTYQYHFNSYGVMSTGKVVSNGKTTYFTSNGVYVPPNSPLLTTVYIYPSGEKYHCKKGCSGADYIAVTLLEAKEMGHTPCKKCYK